ncbi:predicted protein [Histoplasma capsulatum H143]|uniref:Uncharacterized protein n=1 Tax=Ajellomyces capsulatus (strain H143) TaxID=544712 RepID=C6HEH7_AJECH|nr:predicted protein [Histoplasma capsulatum H143]
MSKPELSDRQGRLIVQYDDIDEDICVYRGSHVYQLNLENLGYELVILLPENPITITDGLDTDYWNKVDRDRYEYAPISSHWRPLEQSKSSPSPRSVKELFVRLRKSLIVCKSGSVHKYAETSSVYTGLLFHYRHFEMTLKIPTFAQRNIEYENRIHESELGDRNL